MAAGELSHEQIERMIGDTGLSYHSEWEFGSTYSIYNHDELLCVIEVYWTASSTAPGHQHGYSGHSQYPIPMLKKVVKVNNIRASNLRFNVQGTKTGRFSSSMPNMSNIPKGAVTVGPNGTKKSSIADMTPEEYAKHRDQLHDMLRRNFQ